MNKPKVKLDTPVVHHSLGISDDRMVALRTFIEICVTNAHQMQTLHPGVIKFPEAKVMQDMINFCDDEAELIYGTLVYADIMTKLRALSTEPDTDEPNENELDERLKNHHATIKN